MQNLFLKILENSISASILIVAVILFRLIMKKSSPKWVFCLLWALVGIRLLVPFTVESAWSMLPAFSVEYETESKEVTESFGEESSDSSENSFSDDAPFISDEVWFEEASVDFISGQFPTVSFDNSINLSTTTETESPTDSSPTESQTESQEDSSQTESQTDSSDGGGMGILNNSEGTNTSHGGNEEISEGNGENVWGSVYKIDFSQKTGNVMIVIWLFGTFLLLAYGFFRYFWIKKKVAIFTLCENGVRKCETIESPFVLGVFRPKIYIPFGLSEQTEKYIIAHENAHIERLDHLSKIVAYFALAVHWFNPLAWVSFILLSKDIEYACDEKVIEKYDINSKKEYASALLECSIKGAFISACPVSFGEIGVKERVKNTLSYKKPLLWIIIVCIILVVTLGVFFLTSPESENEKSGEILSGVSDDSSIENLPSESSAENASEESFAPSSEENISLEDEVLSSGDDNSENEASKEETSTSEEPSTENTVEKEVVLYVRNKDVTGFDTVKSKTNGDINNIISQLVDLKTIPEGTKAYSFEIKENMALIDLSTPFGEALGMGTCEETMTTGSLFNTIIKFYNVEKVMFTVEGEILETGYNTYDFPIGFTENQEIEEPSEEPSEDISTAPDIILPPVIKDEDVSYSELGKVDLKGREIFIAQRCYWDSLITDDYTGEVLYFPESSDINPDPLAYYKVEILEQIQKDYNCKINGMMFGKGSNNPVADLQNVMIADFLAGTSKFDILFESPFHYTTFAKEGMLVDVNNERFIKTINTNSSCWDQNAVEDLSLDNKLHFLTGSINTYDDYGTVVMLYNKELFKSLKFKDDLHQIVREGRWTFETLKIYSTPSSLYMDSNGDGIRNEFDYWFMGSDTSKLYHHLVSSGESICEKNGDDKMVFSVDKGGIEGFKNYVDFYLSGSVLLPESYGLVEKYGSFDAAYQSTVMNAFLEGRELFFVTTLENISYYRQMEDEFGILPMPKLNSAQSEYISSVDSKNATVLMIPNTEKADDALGVVIQALAELSEEKMKDAFYYKCLKYRDFIDSESAESLDIIFANRRYDIGDIYGDLLGNPANAYTYLDKDIENRISKIKSEIQNKIDAVHKDFGLLDLLG